MDPLYKVYMNGYCHHLARALHERIGSGIGAIVDLSRRDLDACDEITIEDMINGDVLVDHVFAMLPDGRALDIHGASSPGSIVLGSYWPGGELNTGVLLNLDPSLIDRLISEAQWRPEPPSNLDGVPELDVVVDMLLAAHQSSEARSPVSQLSQAC
jgi:hypothetical protein